MRTAQISVEGILAGYLTEVESGREYLFEYAETYTGPPVSLNMPVSGKQFRYASFPPFFEGLLPEGHQLEGLLREHKAEAGDLFGQLLSIGKNTIGTIEIVANLQE